MRGLRSDTAAKPMPRRSTTPGAERLDDHVGALREPEERLAAGVGLEVEQRPLHAAIAGVGVEGRHDLHGAGTGHGTELDHLGAVVGERARLARAAGPTEARSRTRIPSRAGVGDMAADGRGQPTRFTNQPGTTCHGHGSSRSCGAATVHESSVRPLSVVTWKFQLRSLPSRTTTS